MRISLIILIILILAFLAFAKETKLGATTLATPSTFGVAFVVDSENQKDLIKLDILVKQVLGHTVNYPLPTPQVIFVFNPKSNLVSEIKSVLPYVLTYEPAVISTPDIQAWAKLQGISSLYIVTKDTQLPKDYEKVFTNI